MSDFLDRLIARDRGEETPIQPRRVTPFEPLAAGTQETEDLSPLDRPAAEKARPVVAETAPPPTAAAPPPPGPYRGLLVVSGIAEHGSAATRGIAGAPEAGPGERRGPARGPARRAEPTGAPAGGRAAESRSASLVAAEPAVRSLPSPAMRVAVPAPIRPVPPAEPVALGGAPAPRHGSAAARSAEIDPAGSRGALGTRGAGAGREAAVPAGVARVASPAEPAEGSAGGEAEAGPTIQVTIGRIEVRAVGEAPPPVPARSLSPARLTLEDYLRQRARGER